MFKLDLIRERARGKYCKLRFPALQFALWLWLCCVLCAVPVQCAASVQPVCSAPPARGVCV